MIKFAVRVMCTQWDEANDDIDVLVTLADGRAFSAWLWTRKAIDARMDLALRANGECAGGLYHWAVNMIIVRSLSRDAIERTILDLIATKNLESAFSVCHTDDDDGSDFRVATRQSLGTVAWIVDRRSEDSAI